MKTFVRTIFLLLLATGGARAQAFVTPPFTFVAGQPANASQVMADFQSIVNNGNAVATYLNNKISAVTPPPSGTYLYFYLEACPTGWTASGSNNYYLRNLNQGSGRDPANTPLLGGESPTLQDHTHSTGYYETAVTSVNAYSVGANNEYYATSPGALTVSSTGNVVGATTGEIRPKSVALLLCVKN
jgi:hypothetical protein